MPSHILQTQKASLGQKVLKIQANINVPISALNVRKWLEFPRHTKIGERLKNDSDVRFHTGSRNKAVSRMRTKQYAI